MGKEIVKELVQNNVNSIKIEKELDILLNNSEKIKDDYKELRKIMGNDNATEKIISHIQKN